MNKRANARPPAACRLRNAVRYLYDTPIQQYNSTVVVVVGEETIKEARRAAARVVEQRIEAAEAAVSWRRPGLTIYSESERVQVFRSPKFFVTLIMHIPVAQVLSKLVSHVQCIIDININKNINK